MSSQGGTTGIDITVAEHVNHARAEALHEHMVQNNDKSVQDCIDVPICHHNKKKASNEEIGKSVTSFRSPPAIGRSLEDNWIDAMVALVEKKNGKFQSAELGKYHRNWLLVYDNWRPHPSSLDHQDLGRLAKRLHESSCENAFDKVFILRNSGKRNSYGLLEFPSRSTNYVEYPVYDFLSNDSEEQIEGLGELDVLETTDDYPLDDIMVRSETHTVGEAVKRIEGNRYLMAPDFQRDFVWKLTSQSKLIESCIMRIPLPVLYVAEGFDGRITVVDGLQGLTTFVRFIQDKLKLTSMGNGHPLDGKRYSDLSVNLQERVEDTQLTLYILDKNAPPRAKLDISVFSKLVSISTSPHAAMEAIEGILAQRA